MLGCSVRVMELVQALPEHRLASLLNQHKFSEAEAFALEYKMDQQVHIYIQ